MKVFFIVSLLIATLGWSTVADPVQTPPPQDEEAQALVNTLLSQVPAEALSVRGVMTVRGTDRKRLKIPFQHSILPSPDGWRVIYKTESSAAKPAEWLEVIHRIGKPNEYLYHDQDLGAHAVELKQEDAAVPFAKTDFWLTDLGLEFLHWPDQRLVKDLKITMRKGRPCKVLESTNPSPTDIGYGKVLSWIDSEHGGVIYAEASDPQGRHLKVFEVKAVRDGQVSRIEIRNEQRDTRTSIEFFVESDSTPE